MRLYTLCNAYLSSIQQGIQSAHVTHELFLKYPRPDGPLYGKADNVLWSWARDHKTMIVLNGGINADLVKLREFLTYSSTQLGNTLGFSQGLPWATFNEDGDSLGGILTCIGIVVPEIFYSAEQFAGAGNWYTDATTYHRDPVDIEFIRTLKSKGLAR